ncbi:DUF4861 domain-containing protein [Mangrovimonas sp. AS39]|uniref:DUF4861 family protein n=1 Tax=Mangrovimonas futianensis TaxID=2895523 RepID=UPI001E5D311C|nr:DUF4861 family protein [Mangrovimonas futianensis]MCF1190989.1 DUF4861 domain-containing protein [Mangrovimonas futianensis]MCF1194685.1 DUF4861 domain-containing protein [Mangrovimonas futianensis]
MKKRNYIVVICLGALFLACKNEKKETPDEEVVVEQAEKSIPKTYAEIAIAQGGEWVDGPRGHKEYANGTSFKNVDNLKVPEQHTDHSWYIRYEGPGWESNKVGYRLYLDWRNAIDIFGKKTDSMVLAQVGQDGFDSYHEPEPWGQDILKVGKGLGVGSLGRLVNNEVQHFQEVDSTFASVENSDALSTVHVNYFGWKTGDESIDLKSTLSIQPDKRYTKHTIKPSKAVNGIVTGIINHEVDYLEKLSDNKKWGYIATYGEQTLVPDKLGMAVFYEVATTAEVKKGEFDYLVEFKPTTEPISFYFLGAWEQEPDGIKNKEEFEAYLDGLLAQLNSNNKM